ncbi:hypothetical protein [Cytobacillus purgationiresistens]|uniref:Uncharacterized protein n=1 Tax=Cytobacillus purgationiresistens TaxID=863449 RepID=A0ABU0APJ8_9BACI|nr:hypothetical protein [Cytobacillus purgationiresistens]MDQ0272676.1 hypothetical protein [Cytobacillus purgationiresistens]
MICTLKNNTALERAFTRNQAGAAILPLVWKYMLIKNIMGSLVVSIPERNIQREHLPPHIFHSPYNIIKKTPALGTT